MPSLQTRAFNLLLRVVVRAPLARARHDLDAMVATTRRTFELGELRILRPADVRVVAIERGPVRGEWVERRDGSKRDRAILYLHGGGMVACHPRQYRSMTIPLARRTGVPIFSVDYRLAPEHPYPAALEDALAAYDALRTELPANRIAIVGDSAGGNLALATVLALRARGEGPRPVAGIVAISPWTDLTGSGASILTNEATDVILVPPLRAEVSLARAYAPQTMWRDPLVSPLFGDYADAPPVLAFASASEILLDDARALVAKIRADGGVATLVTEGGLPHIWPVFPIPEARPALQTMADFVARSFRNA